MLPYAAFKKEKVLQEGAPRRVYGILGDAFLQKRVLDAITGWSLSPDARDFNMDTLDGESATLTDIFARCGNLPFLSDYRVVVVHRAERIENLHRGAGSSETSSDDGDSSDGDASTPGAAKNSEKSSGAVKRLNEGLRAIPATTVLILLRTPETPEIGARAKAARCIHASVDKTIESGDDKKTKGVHGLIVDCTINLKDKSTPVALVNDEAMRRNIPLAPDAAAHLVARCGHDVARLLNELEKCALRAGEGNRVTRGIIDEMTRRQVQDTIFDLTDALGERRTSHALGLLRELIESGDAPPQILAMLARHLRQLLQARAFLDAGLPLDASTLRRLPPDLASQLPRDNLANYLQAQSWQGKRLTNQARNFSTPQLQAALEAALRADLAMKGIEGDGGAESRKAPELLLELLVARL